MKNWSKTLKRFIAASAFLFALGITAIYANSTRFVAKGVYLQDQPVEGMSRQEVTDVVREHIQVLVNREVRISDKNIEYRFSQGDLGVRFDIDSTVESLFVGHSMWLKAQVLSAVSRAPEKRVKPILLTQNVDVANVIRARLAKREYPAFDASVSWKDGSWHLEAERFGRKLAEGEAERITREIMKGIYDLNDRKQYHAKYAEVAPKRFLIDIEDILEQVQVFEKAPVKLILAQHNVKELDIRPDAYKWVKIDYENKTVKVNPDQVIAYVDYFAGNFDIEPGTVTYTGYTEHDSQYARGEKYKKALIEGEMKAGRKINRSQMVYDLQAVFDNPNEREINVIFETVPVAINSIVPGVTFSERISVGKSDYSEGNYPNRVHNVAHTLSFQNLSVIAPGETHSFNKVMGWVTLARGWQKGQVIFGNSLRSVAGGGACQASTTEFRAVVNAGLPLVKRKNHSWDVHYYQDWYGVDAATYPPGRVDLMFINDTPGHILIHTYTDPENEFAYVDFYGVSDGRTVRVEEVENTKIGAGRKVVNNWFIDRADGTTEQREIMSRYRR